MSDQELELVREEYRRLSQEISSTLSHRLQIVQFGLVIVGALVSFAITAANTWSAFVGAVMIPAACSMIVFLWLSEVRRTRRASWYIYGLERRVNRELGHRVLRWEEDIRGKQFHPLAVFRFHYYTTAYFFVLVAIAASLYGVQNWNGMPNLLRVGWPIAFGVGIILTVSYSLRRLRMFDFPDSSWPEIIPDKPLEANGDNGWPA